jgi:hypothetical protein
MESIGDATSTLVDAFVSKINSEPREPLPTEEVPAPLRKDGDYVWYPDIHTGWRIVADDNSERIAALQSRIGRRFPPSFLNFISRYSFPAFEFGPLLFFANHREETYWDLSRKVFLDPGMSPLLLGGGFIQVGNPFFYNYDPVCFDCNLGSEEPRLVQLDHEAILCDREIRIIEVVSPSFIDFLKAAVGGKFGPSATG